MNKNLLLYILLVFLIVVNGFFLYNYLGRGEQEQELQERKPPIAFLGKELGFDDAQKEEFRALTRTHRRKMRGISDDIRGWKDDLFKGLSDDSLTDIDTEALAYLIGQSEAAKDLEVLRHFKQVRELCNDQQKEKFSKIIKDALRHGSREQGPPPEGRPNRDRPQHPDRPNGNRPPRY
ncbi:hypothetical protein [uncultured Algibacter sp.]|uniref:hypothetical protein n=1 Tax=uncultured Algibacter sp. TaxID=298659 RepID=UPI0026253CC8|nr:hypothetical protein [uncultured Algibacter sp.]